MKKNSNRCPLCNGIKELSTTTFTVDVGSTLIIVRNTPATICSLCGEEWISDKVAESLEVFVDEAKRKNRVMEVINFSLEKVA